MKKSLLSLPLLVAAMTAQAAAPSAGSLSSGLSFAQYAGAAVVGQGGVDDNATLYFIDEARTATEKAWTIFFDPSSNKKISATLNFDQPILAVQTSSAAWGAGNATYGVGQAYGGRGTAGLEIDDVASWSAGARTLTLQWNVNKWGDHIRVITAVPEPSTYAMMLIGFALVGWAGLRRQRRG